MKSLKLVVGLYLLSSIFNLISAQSIYQVPSEYQTIQEAVNMVKNSQDVVLIAPGIYTGEGNRDIVIDGEDVTIIGNGTAQEVIIDAGGDEGEIHNIFNIEGYSSFYICLRNLTLQGAFGKSCIKANDTTLIINDCVIQNNSNCQIGAGINIANGLLSANQTEFVNNTAFISGGALYSTGCINLYRCDFYKNYAVSTGGAIKSSGFLHINDCSFSNNECRWDGGAISVGEEAYYPVLLKTSGINV